MKISILNENDSLILWMDCVCYEIVESKVEKLTNHIFNCKEGIVKKFTSEQLKGFKMNLSGDIYKENNGYFIQRNVK